MMTILIAGPYRSDTKDDPAKIAANVQAMESYAIPVFEKGHIPMLGEWPALPLVKLAGSKRSAMNHSMKNSSQIS